MSRRLLRAGLALVALCVVLDRPDPTAPVSDPYLFGRKQDLAFDRSVGFSDRTGQTLWGRNGGGERYFTDGELWVGLIPADNQKRTMPPEILPVSPAIALKNWLVSGLRPVLD